jgi:hypothetical protein
MVGDRTDVKAIQEDENISNVMQKRYQQTRANPPQTL